MNKPKSKKYQVTFKKNLSLLCISTLSLLLIVTTGCSSTCRKRELMTQVLDRQNEVLQKIKVERETDTIAKKVKADAALSNAEQHLDEAIESILNSNSVFKSAL